MQATRDILEVADPWRWDLSPLEMGNADTKRVASSSGSRRLELATSGLNVVPMRGGHFGPERLIQTKGCGTTMAVSTLKHLIISQKLKRGDRPEGVCMPASRRNERLFGLSGRSSYRSNGIKFLEKLGDDYEPRDDSCIKAFVRLLARIAHAAVLAESETDSA